MRKKENKKQLFFIGIAVVVIAAVCLSILIENRVGRVSEQEAAFARKQYESSRLSSRNESYPFCNDRNLYSWNDEETGIEQRTLEGELIKTYPCFDDSLPCYVNNEEIFFIRYLYDESTENELWSIPLVKNDSGADVLDGEKAEKILSTADISDAPVIWADKDVITYCDNSDSVGGTIYKEYDRKNKKEIFINEKDKNQNYCIFSVYPTKDKTVLLCNDQYTHLYAHKIGSGKVTKLSAAQEECVLEEDSFLSTSIGNYIFYAENSGLSDIWMYRSDIGNKTTLFTMEDIEQALKDAGLSGSYKGIQSLCADGNTLYIQIETDENGGSALFQSKISEKPKLVCEEKSNDYARDRELVGVVENKLLLIEDVDKEIVKEIYDMAKQQFIEVEEDDEEASYFYFWNDSE